MNNSKLAEKIICFLAKQLPYDKKEKRTQEWLALLDHTPKNSHKLLFSLSFIPVVLKTQETSIWTFLLEFPTSFFKDLVIFHIEILKAVYFSIVLAIYPVIIFSLLILFIPSLSNLNQSGLFSLIYLFLLITPSFISLSNQGIITSASQLKFPPLWNIPKPYLHLWFSAKIFSLIGIIEFDVHDISYKLNFFGLLCISFLLWPLANRSLKNNAELISPQN